MLSSLRSWVLSFLVWWVARLLGWNYMIYLGDPESEVLYALMFTSREDIANGTQKMWLDRLKQIEAFKQ